MDETTRTTECVEDRTGTRGIRGVFGLAPLRNLGTLACIAGAAVLLHGLAFSALEQVAPIGVAGTTEEITLVIDPDPNPIQIVADVR
ncbi:MAG: hypothetical protein VXY94_09890 [Planctomycetota bacterium]|nr:hypothetical protein [Planctomycetota bacterium]MEC8733781.1 hypothetical protein [Planctomycetota bacterium]MEC9158118.1 hypothetical protein [Planctomycetota bacterium]MEC9232897.1 hypothetical protein [Planctomycetota bacterium]MED5506859.1 hypothetical protein [Planctomycetota bacterium]